MTTESPGGPVVTVPRRRVNSPLAGQWTPGFSNIPIGPGPLRLRLALPFVVLFAAIMLVLGLFLGALIRDIYVDRLSTQLDMQVRILASSVGREMESGASQAVSYTH